MIVLAVLCWSLWCIRLLYLDTERVWRDSFMVAWAIGPPLYFLFNYYFLFRYFGKVDDPVAVAHHARSQNLFTTLWAAIGALTVLVATGHISAGR